MNSELKMAIKKFETANARFLAGEIDREQLYDAEFEMMLQTEQRFVDGVNGDDSEREQSISDMEVVAAVFDRATALWAKERVDN